MLMFLFKKIVTPLFMPLPLVIGTMLAGLGFLWFARRKQTAGILLAAGWLLLTLLSFRALPDWLLGTLEHRYAPLRQTAVDKQVSWVVVLGGGITSDPVLPPLTQLSDASRARLIEGIRIHRMLPQSTLVLSGGSVFDPKPEAEVMHAVALSLGVDPRHLLMENRSRDTKDQAAAVGRIVGGAPFYLVTTAAHMPRAMALFRKQNLAPLPAPTDFRVKSDQALSPGDFFPDPGNLEKAGFAVHEYLGLLWAAWRGQT
jgi:uncharacterized SAM-binding protein YcdF (DUF218 family)